MSKEKTWLDTKLSDFVELSLAKGLIPMFKFIDKDKLETSAQEVSLPITEETPTYILQKQIKMYERFIERIKSRDGLVGEGKEFDEKMESITLKLESQIDIFKAAVKQISHDRQSATG